MRLLLLYLLLTFSIQAQTKDFFLDITNKIQDNEFRLSYGISVTDVNKDNKFDFVVTGFGFKNLALTYKDGKLVNIINDEMIDDKEEYLVKKAMSIQEKQKINPS